MPWQLGFGPDDTLLCESDFAMGGFISNES